MCIVKFIIFFLNELLTIKMIESLLLQFNVKCHTMCTKNYFCLEFGVLQIVLIYHLAVYSMQYRYTNDVYASNPADIKKKKRKKRIHIIYRPKPVNEL